MRFYRGFSLFLNKAKKIQVLKIWLEIVYAGLCTAPLNKKLGCPKLCLDPTTPPTKTPLHISINPRAQVAQAEAKKCP